jgi:hypothetical protein
MVVKSSYCIRFKTNHKIGMFSLKLTEDDKTNFNVGLVWQAGHARASEDDGEVHVQPVLH